MDDLRVTSRILFSSGTGSRSFIILTSSPSRPVNPATDAGSCASATYDQPPTENQGINDNPPALVHGPQHP